MLLPVIYAAAVRVLYAAATSDAAAAASDMCCYATHTSANGSQQKYLIIGRNLNMQRPASSIPAHLRFHRIHSTMS